MAEDLRKGTRNLITKKWTTRMNVESKLPIPFQICREGNCGSGRMKGRGVAKQFMHQLK